MKGEGEGVTGSRAEALQIALCCTEHLAKPIPDQGTFRGSSALFGRRTCRKQKDIVK